MIFRTKIIKVVHKSGNHRGADSSLNILSNNQIKNMFIAKLKAPKVSILKGRVIAFKMGFIKIFINPKTTPKTKKICHWPVRGIPNRFDSGFKLIFTPETNDAANQRPNEAAAI